MRVKLDTERDTMLTSLAGQQQAAAKAMKEAEEVRVCVRACVRVLT